MEKPKLPKKLTSKNIRIYKSDMRKWDQWRIKNNICTPEEISRENSIFPIDSDIKVIRFPKF